jgi:hypothetical protein
MEPEGSLPHSQEPATCPYPEPLLKSYQTISPGPRFCMVFRNMVTFYGEDLLAPRPTPKLEDHPLSAVRDCIFEATLHIRRPFLHPQPEDAPCRGDRDRHIVVTGTDLSWWQEPTNYNINNNNIWFRYFTNFISRKLKPMKMNSSITFKHLQRIHFPLLADIKLHAM